MQDDDEDVEEIYTPDVSDTRYSQDSYVNQNVGNFCKLSQMRAGGFHSHTANLKRQTNCSTWLTGPKKEEGRENTQITFFAKMI